MGWSEVGQCVPSKVKVAPPRKFVRRLEGPVPRMPFTLSVETLTSRTFTLHDVSESDTIADIKRRIEALESAPVEAQALTWGGCTLGYSTSSFLNLSRPEHDQHTLASCI